MDDVRLHSDLLDQSTLGPRVRAIRKALGMTLADVSNVTGLSISALSKIENEQVSPTFVNLMRLAEGLRIPLGDLVTLRRPDGDKGARMAVARGGELEFRSTPKYDMAGLFPDYRRKRMTPMVNRVKADNPTVLDAMISHSGEEFFYVLDGVIEVHTELYDPVRLEQGDSCYLDSSVAHTVTALDDRDAMVLMVWLGPAPFGDQDGVSMAEAVLNGFTQR